ncbi:hypothetical protein MMC07_003112 [Pseudocyphellaria aurata]|nr:hypothetical protein [Pseudocyphellaria aurata]
MARATRSANYRRHTDANNGAQGALRHWVKPVSTYQRRRVKPPSKWLKRNRKSRFRNQRASRADASIPSAHYADATHLYHSDHHFGYVLLEVLALYTLRSICNLVSHLLAREVEIPNVYRTSSNLKTVDGTPLEMCETNARVSQSLRAVLLDQADDDKGFLLVIEYMECGDLWKAHENKNISLDELVDICPQFMGAISYLQEMGVIHRDMKPRNILVKSRNPQFIIKICDFGISTEYISSRAHETQCGTSMFSAPEIYQKRYSPPIDIWAPAVPILVFVKNLSELRNCEDIWRQTLVVIEEAIHAPNVPLMETSLLLVLEKVLQEDPKERLAAQACLNLFRDVANKLEEISTVALGPWMNG